MTRAVRLSLSFVIAFAALASEAPAQTPEGVDILLSKARSLEARGRMDLAVQNWNQVLLVDPNQIEALAGLARNAKQNGDAQGLRALLDRVRRINPRDPVIEAIENLHVLTPKELGLLDTAGRLAGQHKPDEAMAIYRRVFGDAPPQGKWADAFYETEAASTGGREQAIAQLRDRAARDPANEMYRFWLARVLTYDPKTRLEGLRLLESMHDPGAVDQARTVWRQALVWEKDNVQARPFLEAYVRRYPDPELQDRLDAQYGFRALGEKNLATAQAKFEDIVKRTPNDASALVGLGYVRLGQKKFDQALALFSRARDLAPGRADAKDGYGMAAFWIAMQRGSALQANQPEAAIAAFQEAAGLRPDNEQPLLAIAQIMQRRGNLVEAQTRFEQVLKAAPNNVDALAGLAFVRLSQKDFDAAGRLFARARTLAPARPEIDEGYRTVRFWDLVQQGGDALARSDIAAAIARYNEALAIDPRGKDALVGLAEAARRKGNRAEVLDAYGRLAAAYPADVRGWLGLMRTEIDANNSQAALDLLPRIPEPTRHQLEVDSEYLARLAQAYYMTGRPADGRRALAAALDAGRRSDSDEALNVRLRVAALLMDAGNDEDAASTYKQAVDAHPDHATAWEGLIGAYTRKRDFTKALTAVRSMPPRAYDAAATSPGFLSAAATAYAAEGFCAEAERLLTRSIEIEKAAGRAAATTELQRAEIWSREGRHDRATQGYRTVVSVDDGSINGWRGYIAALHNERQDYSALAEMQRMPAAVSTTLMSDPNFLRLVSSIESSVGNNARSVELLQEARTRHRALGQISPPDLDLQLAWTMVGGSKYSGEVPALVGEIRARTDLRPDQRDALEEISSAYAVRTAEAALRADDSARAVAILAGASIELPADAGIRSALASVYVRQHQYERALDVYRSRDMNDANAGEFRTAAGTALAAHKTIVAERFLWEGRQRWPNDPELLHMSALQALSHDDYDAAERYLTTALAAARRERPGPVHKNASAPAESAAWTGGLSCGDATASDGPAVAAGRPVMQRASDGRDQSTLTAERIQDELDAVRNRNPQFIDVGVPVGIRLGDPGVNRLYTLDRTIGGSVAVADAVRIGVDAHFLQLESGTPNGRSGYRFGSLPLGKTFAEQGRRGWAGGVQLSGDGFGVAFGMLPREFPVQNWTGGVRIGSPDDLVRLIVGREAVKDSLLSYAGARDPGTGRAWGGVVSNSAAFEFNHGDADSGQYASAGASLLRGFNVADNWSAQATMGAYWRVVASEHGGLSLGVNATGMHYDRNLNFFSLGHGGYFSPQRYLLGTVPISWLERRGRVEYEIVASGGVQRIEQDGAPLDPTRSDPTGSSYYKADSRRGANYNVQLRLEYQIAPHWDVQAFGGANNARDFASRAFQISLKCFLNPVPSGTHVPVRRLPDWRGARLVRVD